MSNKKALEGLRVLDFTQFLAGPYCGMYFADMGAEVIKIENTKIGDFTRTGYPKKNGVSMYFNNVNRNKKSVTLNLKSPEGKEIFKRLIESADILIENNRPGVMKRLGFDYESAKKINKRIIYASISGFGQTGPYSKRPGYDIIAQAMGGAMSVTGYADGPATRSGVALGDILGGMNAAIGILAALRYREISGEGQYIDVALVDSIVSSLETISTQYIYEGKIPQRTGNRYLAAYPYDSFTARDGDYVLACGTDEHFKTFAEVMEMPELITDIRFADMTSRKANAAELKAIINKWGSNKAVAEIFNKVNEAGIPVAPILDIKQVYEDEHIHQAREMFIKVNHPEAGETVVTGNAIKMSETKLEVYKSAPLLGENNVEIYTALGYDEETLKEYKNRNII